MHPTRNTLSASARAGSIRMLDALLADAIDLQTQCKQAHWSVKGPTFIALHELFDRVNEGVEEYVDLIAERAVQLGGTVEGTVRAVAARSRLPEYAAKGCDGRAHADALSAALAAFGTRVRTGIAEADGLDDPATADVLTEVLRGTDQWLWFVEAHLEGER
jgi:starvation-inducible DNA-binding protein